MEPISFTLDDFYFVVDPFKFSVVNGVVTMVQDPVPISLQGFDARSTMTRGGANAKVVG